MDSDESIIDSFEYVLHNAKKVRRQMDMLRIYVNGFHIQMNGAWIQMDGLRIQDNLYAVLLEPSLRLIKAKHRMEFWLLGLLDLWGILVEPWPLLQWPVFYCKMSNDVDECHDENSNRG